MRNIKSTNSVIKYQIFLSLFILVITSSCVTPNRVLFEYNNINDAYDFDTGGELLLKALDKEFNIKNDSIQYIEREYIIARDDVLDQKQNIITMNLVFLSVNDNQYPGYVRQSFEIISDSLLDNRYTNFFEIEIVIIDNINSSQILIKSIKGIFFDCNCGSQLLSSKDYYQGNEYKELIEDYLIEPIETRLEAQD
jgi:hypothetical protein